MHLHPRILRPRALYVTVVPHHVVPYASACPVALDATGTVQLDDVAVQGVVACGNRDGLVDVLVVAAALGDVTPF